MAYEALSLPKKTSRNPYPKRGQIKSKIFGMFVKSVVTLVSSAAGGKRKRGGGSASATPTLSVPKKILMPKRTAPDDLILPFSRFEVLEGEFHDRQCLCCCCGSGGSASTTPALSAFTSEENSEPRPMILSCHFLVLGFLKVNFTIANASAADFGCSLSGEDENKRTGDAA